MNRSTGGNFTDTEFKFASDGNAYSDGAWWTSGADFAEWFEKEGEVKPRDIIGLNLKTGKVRKYRSGDMLMGIYSEEPGFAGSRDLDKTYNEMMKTHALVGLVGQVDYSKKQTKNIGNKIYTEDGKLIGYLLSNGRVYINNGVTEIMKLKENVTTLEAMINMQKKQIDALRSEIENIKRKKDIKYMR
jgi:hypothetical protein